MSKRKEKIEQKIRNVFLILGKSTVQRHKRKVKTTRASLCPSFRLALRAWRMTSLHVAIHLAMWASLRGSLAKIILQHFFPSLHSCSSLPTNLASVKASLLMVVLTCSFIPFTTICPGPFQNFQMPTSSSFSAC